VIRSFGDRTTEDIWRSENSKAARRIPKQLWPNVWRKLDLINRAREVSELGVLPGNRLHTLKAELARFYAIRVNDQYRIIFRFEGPDAFEVRCTDYH
jgi:proteic killer suppression protein